MFITQLKALKEEKKLTNQQLADLSGVPVGTINRILAGQTDNPSFQTVCDIVMAMDGSLDELAGIKENSRQEEQEHTPGKDMVALYKTMIGIKDTWIHRLFVACCLLVVAMMGLIIGLIVVGGNTGTAMFAMPADAVKAMAAHKEEQTLLFVDVAGGEVAKTYGDAAFHEGVIGAKTTVTYASSDETVATADSTSGTVTILKAGTTTITATAEETETHAGGEASYTLTVAPKEINVTAEDRESFVGAEMAELTYTADPLCGEDSFSGALATEADKNVAGYYAITRGNLTAGDNYTIHFTFGTYTVMEKATQTLTFEGVPGGTMAKTYGDAAFTRGVSGAETTVTYKSNSPSVAMVDEISGTVTIRRAGTATITATAAEGTAHAGATASYTVTVAPKEINVIADSKNALVGEDSLDLTYTADPLCGQDRFSGTLATGAVNDVAGEYEITQGTLTAGDNYTIHFTPGIYTVNTSSFRVIDRDLRAGEQMLALDGVTLGTYILEESGNGWIVQNADGDYLTFHEADKTVSWTETATVWSYNGGLYVPVQETQDGNGGIVGESDYYLAMDNGGNLMTTLSYTFATVQETEVFGACDSIDININASSGICNAVA